MAKIEVVVLSALEAVFDRDDVNAHIIARFVEVKEKKDLPRCDLDARDAAVQGDC